MEENKVAKILYIIGIAIIIIGFIFAFVFSSTEFNMYQTDHGEIYVGFSFTNFLITLFISFVVGMLFIGFSEIIKLLHSINHKTGNPVKEDHHEETPINVHEEVKPVSWTLDEAEKNKIHDYYANEQIEKIIPTYLDDFCIVILNKDSNQIVKVIDVSGFGVKEVHDKKLRKQLLDWYSS